MLELGIVGGVIVLIGLILILIPTRFLNIVFGIFSLGNYGVRYIRRRRDHTDSLANFFLFISLILSCTFFLIPGYQYVIGAWLTFAFLCTFGQATRVCVSIPAVKAKIVLFGVYLMFACGLASSIGFINGFVVNGYISAFTKAIFGGEAKNVFFYLQSPLTFYMLIEGFIIFVSCYNLWAQFKYLRLENTYKAKWMVTYIMKILFVCAVVIGTAYFGFNFVGTVYQIDKTIV